MKRVWGRSYLIFLGIMLLLVVAVPVSGRQDAVATLDPVQGLVQYQPAGAAADDWQTVTRVQLVSQGDRIRTDALGLAYLTFFEGVQTEILPNSLVKVSEFDFVDENSPVITLEMSIGDMRHQIDQTLDADSHYEVYTPSTVVAVRGTNFWTSGTWLSEAYVSVLQGRVDVAGIAIDGQLGVPVQVMADQSVEVFPLGQVGQVETLDPATLPQYPPSAPLAPATCGNGVCDSGETEDNCALDCKALPGCGDQVCSLEVGEGPVTCPADCVPKLRRQIGEGEGDTEAPATTGPVSQEPCTVQADRLYVNVRVGPGLSRGVRSDMPVGRAITVVGKATDDDGMLWWLIQPPGYNPAESQRYWVAADEVQETGNCDQVPDVAASPVIAPPPTQSPESIAFVADRYAITPGECVTLSWSAQGVRRVSYQGATVDKQGSRVECPLVTTTYTLTVTLNDGSTVYQIITITVGRVPDYGY